MSNIIKNTKKIFTNSTITTGGGGGGDISGSGASNQVAFFSNSSTIKSSQFFKMTDGAVNFTIGLADPNQNPTPGEYPHIFEIVNSPDLGIKSTIAISSYGTTGLGGENNIHLNRYRGTIDTPTAIKDGDFMLSIGFRGFDGSNLSQSTGAFQYLASEDWTTGANGAKFQIQSTPNGLSATGRTNIMTIGGETNVVKISKNSTYAPYRNNSSLCIDLTTPVVTSSSLALLIQTKSNSFGGITIGEDVDSKETIQYRYGSTYPGNYFGTLPIANSFYYSNGNENASGPMVFQSTKIIHYCSSNYNTGYGIQHDGNGILIDHPNNFGGSNTYSFEVKGSVKLTGNYGVFGATPVAQQDSTITGATYTGVGGTPISTNDTFGGYTIGQVVAILKLYGLLA